MPEEKAWIDPLKFEAKDMPIWVFSDDLRSFFSWGIKSHSKGNWSHVMIMVEPGYVVTQGLTYKQIPLIAYMGAEYRLKFWQYPYLTNLEKSQIFSQVGKDLAAPWWRRNYDFLGILGFAFGIRWLQSPFQKYCSERVAGYLLKISALKGRIIYQSSPSELNQLMIKTPEFKLLGYHWVD